MGIQLDARYNQPERQNAFFRGLIGKTSAIPGVQAAAAINHLPLGGGESLSSGLRVEGQPFDEKILFEDSDITPGYFAAMGIPLLGGRDFTDDDAAGRPPVAIVNRRFAKRYFPGRGAVGKRYRDGNNVWWTIVGVAGDVRHANLETIPPIQIYKPLWQNAVNSLSILARTTLPPDRLAAATRDLVRSLDPAVALANVRTMNQLVSASMAESRFQTLLVTAFGGVALLLSLVGLYALMTYSVEQRTAKMVRLRLGFDALDVQFALRDRASRCASFPGRGDFSVQ